MCTVYCIELALMHFIISANSFRVHCFCEPLCTHTLSFFTLVSHTHTHTYRYSLRFTPCLLSVYQCPLIRTVCALIFAGFIFRGFAIFAFFAFLNSRLLGAVVLKYLRIYGLSPYAIIVYGSCRSAKLAVLVVGFV